MTTLLLIAAGDAVDAFASQAVVEAALEECTIGVACPAATLDGRPLLWKTRDTSTPDNEVYFNTLYPYDYLAIVNANGDPLSKVWMGINERGFAILNSNCTDLTPDSLQRSNGYFMRDALGHCRSVEEFAAMLDSTNGSREVTASFGVIDSTGAAFIFEASYDSFWTYDASEAPGGFIVRANFACNDTSGVGLPSFGGGIERYRRSMKIIGDLRLASNLSHTNLLDVHMRDFSDEDGIPYDVPCYDCGEPDSLYGYIPTGYSICGRNTMSATIFQGVDPNAQPPEPAYLSTMWTLLGQPASTIVIPFWPVGPAPPAADGPVTAPLCDRALSIRDHIYNQQDIRLADSFRFLDGEGGGIWSELHPVEDAIVAGMNLMLDEWRAAPPSIARMLAVEDSLAQHVLHALLELTPVPDWGNTHEAGFSLLRGVYPNPFNSSTLVAYELPRAADVSLHVYDTLGRHVAGLAEGRMQPGRYTVSWEAREQASGVYLIRLSVDGEYYTRKSFHIR